MHKQLSLTYNSITLDSFSLTSLARELNVLTNHDYNNTDIMSK